MTAEDIIRSLWSRIDDRDWAGLRELLDDHLVVRWPDSRELITGPDDFVAVQREYPEGWSIRVLGIVSQGDRVVSEVEVPQEGVGVFRVVSIWTVTDDRVADGREYWVTVGGGERPTWREKYTSIEEYGETA